MSRVELYQRKEGNPGDVAKRISWNIMAYYIILHIPVCNINVHDITACLHTRPNYTLTLAFFHS